MFITLPLTNLLERDNFNLDSKVVATFEQLKTIII